MRNLRYRNDRQTVAICVGFFGWLGGIVVVLVAMLLASGWLDVMNAVGHPWVPHIHDQVWGWLSVKSIAPAIYEKRGNHYFMVQKESVVYDVRGFPFYIWSLAWVSVYLTYQVCEGVSYGIEKFAHLAKQHS